MIGTTAAVIDRLVHHSVILEMTGTSVRADAAEQAKKEGATTVTGRTTAKGKHPAHPTSGTRSTLAGGGVPRS